MREVKTYRIEKAAMTPTREPISPPLDPTKWQEAIEAQPKPKSVIKQSERWANTTRRRARHD